MAKKETSAAEPQSADQSTNPSIGLQDLVLCAQIIQLSSQRGTFRAEELANVGTLYNKLVSFLEASGAITRESAKDTQQENSNA